MKERVTTLISQEEIKNKTKEIAEKIMQDYEGKELYLVCVLKGAVIFMVDIAREIKNIPVKFCFMDVSSYGASTESSGNLVINMDLDEDIKGKDVLIVEDIIDSGRTLSKLYSMLSQREPASLRICTFLDKPDRRVTDIKSDYTCFNVPDEFVVGYGLDYDQRYRNLEYLGILHFDEE